MPEHPLLLLPFPDVVHKRKEHGGASAPPRMPSPNAQKGRLLPKFHQLAKAFRDKRVELRHDPSGAEPEKVLVLETVSSVDEFHKALRGLEGLEWLSGFESTEIEPDEDFYHPHEAEKRLKGRIYLIVSNQKGLKELLRLWNLFRKNPENPEFAHGRKKWRHLFSGLKDIRPWGPEDRLQETGIQAEWERRLAQEAETVGIEIELWYRTDENARENSDQSVRKLIDQAGGRTIARAVIPEIRYHALLAELPIQRVGSLVRLEETQLVRCDNIMFFRPQGQATISVPVGDPVKDAFPGPQPLPEQDPVVALLDGLPLQNHSRLEGRLIVDDPDDWAADYPANERVHGTAMASLIVHDELDSDQASLARPIYVRPIMRPDPSDFRRPRSEEMSSDELHVDLVHRAVRRLFEDHGSGAPAAPTVKIINLSICDTYRPFFQTLSPWARLLDYLSYKYRVLFIVSIGNHTDSLDIGCYDNDVDSLRKDSHSLEKETIISLARSGLSRRLLAPSEAVNALTVGSLHSDDSPDPQASSVIDPYRTASLPSPLNKQGPGFRRAIKPEILVRGGRQCYEEPLVGKGSIGSLRISRAVAPPGQRVACPGREGERDRTIYVSGTSNAAALATRTAARFYDLLEALSHEPGGDRLDEAWFAVIIKALLVHGASWGEAQSIIRGHLSDPGQSLGAENRFRDEKSLLARLLGYGMTESERVFQCTQQRATLLGFGHLERDEAHRYSLPLPPSLSGSRCWRRITVTLAWCTPTNPSNRRYRRAKVWFEPYGHRFKNDQRAAVKEGEVQSLLGIDRKEAEWQAVKRGTVQHEIMEGMEATSFPDESRFQIQVNCGAEGKDNLQGIRLPYGLVITLEVAADLALPLYQEIRDRILVRIPT